MVSYCHARPKSTHWFLPSWDALVIDHLPYSCLLGLHLSDIGFHLNLIGYGPDLQRNVHSRVAVYFERDPELQISRKSFFRHFEPVGTDREARQDK